MGPFSFGSALSHRKDYKWWVFGCVVLGTFLTVVDLNTLNVALPTIGARFGANLSFLQWVILANALTVTALLLPMGRLGDMLGRKSMYMLGITIFAVGAVLAGSSVSLAMLILSRVVQGVGGAMIQSNSMAMSLSVFPLSERGKVIGFNLSVVGLAGIAGPVIGGLLVTALGWRSIFAITGGVAMVALAVAATVLDKRRFVAQPPDGFRKQFDWLGATLSGVALFIFLLVMTNGYRLGWLSPPIILGAVAFGALFAAFLWWQLRAPAPLLELGLFKRRVFSLAAAAAWIANLGTASVMFLMPLLLQGVLGYSPREVGLILLPSAVFMAVIAPLAGRLSDRFGWRRFTVGGMTLSIAAMVAFSTTLSVSVSIALIIPLLIVRIIALALFNPPNTSSLFSAVEHSRYGAVSALTQVIRNSGTVTGIAIVTMVIVATMNSMGFDPSLDAVSSGDGAVAQAFITGARRAFLVLAGLFSVALVLSIAKGGKLDPREPVSESSRP